MYNTYKIVAAINSMIEKADLIGNVIVSEKGALYFTYDSQIKWSIAKKDYDHYDLIYYPGGQQLEELSATDSRYFKECVIYSTEEIKTKEAIESFSELYKTVQNKLYKIDDVLDYIINTAA